MLFTSTLPDHVKTLDFPLLDAASSPVHLYVQVFDLGERQPIQRFLSLARFVPTGLIISIPIYPGA